MRSLAWLVASAALVVSGELRADEGMWPFNMIPKEALAKAHGIALSDAWLDHVRMASIDRSGAITGMRRPG